MGLLNFFSSLFGKAKQTEENINVKKSEIAKPILEEASEIIKENPKVKKAPVKKAPVKKVALKDQVEKTAEKTTKKVAPKKAPVKKAPAKKTTAKEVTPKKNNYLND